MMKEAAIGVATLSISILTSVGSTSYIVGSSSAKMEAKIEANSKGVANNEKRIDEWAETTKVFVNTLNDIRVDVAVTKENVLWLKEKDDAENGS
ncbi:hypothetical protein S1R3Y_000047 [Vibrio phage vB_ValP_VA-RY-3]|nr:hypothetical protein S1R3Y_000047 [Vibrio phage vB_ValP_VA-RY-3]